MAVMKLININEYAARDPSWAEIEDLFVNNIGLQKIEAYLSLFNPITVMKMAHMEIRHSAILSWLLDPGGSHGLGDNFLKAFLGESLRGNANRLPSALEIAQADLRDVEVRNEWHNIDIFLQSPRNRWAFIIENKFYSGQHSKQLRKYKEHVQSLFISQYGVEKAKEMIVRGVFLTLRQEAPEDPEYTSIRYAQICAFLRRFLETESHLISPEVTTFLYHYLDILEKETGMHTEQEKMEHLARQLYRSHKKVLDFVMKHGAGSAFSLAARSLFGDAPKSLEGSHRFAGQQFLFSGLSNSQVSFLPLSWFDALGQTDRTWPGCEKWWAGYPVIAWLELWPESNGVKGNLYLYAEVGPLSSHEFRKALIESIQGAVINNGELRFRFQSGATDQGRRYSKFLKDNRISVNDVHDAEEIAKAMDSLVARFGDEFSTIAELLQKFTRYGDMKG